MPAVVLRRHAVIPLVCLSMVLGLAEAGSASATASVSHKPPAQQVIKPVAVRASVASLPTPSAGLTTPLVVHHVTAGTFSITLKTAGWHAAGPDGIQVQTASSASPVTAALEVLDKATAAKHGITGLALRISRTDGGSSAAPVKLSIPTALVDGMFGGDYASRIHWVEVPDCTGTAACSKQTPLMTQAASVTTSASGSPAGAAATVVTPSVSSTPMLVVAMSSPTSSTGGGNFAATPLKSSDSWQVSPQTGDFQWSYALNTIAPPAGPHPSLALNYNSTAIDGETGATNNQGSAIGDGWQFSGVGFIERSYVPCFQDGGPASSNDLCWKSDNATLSFGGHSGPLVKDTATGVWRLANDDGTRVEKLTGAGNAALNGEYWRLTTPDGTQYYFGMNTIPGVVHSDSAWTVPVFGNDAGDPCHAASFTASECVQGWRWNLDYVVDVHGNSETLYYQKDTNNYAMYGQPTVATPYDLGGTLLRIDYGMRAGSESQGTDPFFLSIYQSDRCASNCSVHNATNWPDTPWDLYCTAAPCTATAPSFWDTKLITGLSSFYRPASGGATSGMNYYFTQGFAGIADPYATGGTSYQMVLNTITQDGELSSSGVTMPVTTFTGTFMANRVNAATLHQASLYRQRITGVTTEAGATVTVSYPAPQCTGTTLPANAYTDTMRCFQQLWTPAGGSQQNGWFNVYPVSSVIQDSNRATPAGVASKDQSYYDYSIGTSAWRYDTSPFIAATDKTWSGFAGYTRVRVEHGDPTVPSTLQTTDYLYFQGMDGDRLNPAGGTKSVSVTASDSTAITDSLWWAGQVREQITYSGLGGAVVTGTITDPWASAATASDGINTAHQLGVSDARTRVALSSGGYRNTEIRTLATDRDSLGRPLMTSDLGDTSTASDDLCTTTTYATSSTLNILNLVASALVVAKACHAAVTYPADGVSFTADYYDGSTTLGSAPTAGDLTQARTAKQFGSDGTPVTITTATNTYDGLGRELSTSNALSELTQYAYTPAFNPASPGTNVGPLTQMVTTNPMGWTTTEGFDPSGSLELSAIDANGNRSDATYDGIGRVLQVWSPDRPKTSNPNSPSISYTYSYTAPFSSSTTTLTPSGGTATSYALYDGLLRLRQTQGPAEGTNQQAPPGNSGSDITDSVYDAAGRQVIQNHAYLITNAPFSTLWVPANGETAIPSETSTLYDGAGRPTAQLTLGLGVEKFRTSTAYGGNHVDVTPASGGTPTTTTFDARGNTTNLLQYHASTPTGAADSTSYTYDSAGDMLSMTDPATNRWSWTYDLFGDKLTAADPDTGTTASTYDDLQRLTNTTDGRGAKLQYGYDTLDRKTTVSEYQTAGAGWALDAAWTYDTLAKGQLTSSTRYIGSIPTAAGAPYITSVVGYDAMYRPQGTSYTLPSVQGALAGTYTTSYTYNPDGSTATQTDPAEGGLPAETITAKYTAIGYQSDQNLSDSNYHINYNTIGQVSQDYRSNSTQKLWDTYGYDAPTHRLSYQVVTNSNSPHPTVASNVYYYNNAGNVLAVQNTPSTGPIDTQCFYYDYLQRLTQADTPNTNNCSTTPTNTNQGGPAPYWQNYTYDLTGNRTQITRHATTGTGTDHRETYAYPTAGAGHQLQSVTHATAPAGSSTYTNTGTDNYAYDAAGNTTTAPGQTLTYDAQGNHVTTASGGQTENEVYDTGGNLLVHTDPTNGATAYLGDTELYVSPGGNTVTGNRTYQDNGAAFACRTTTGGTGAVLNWLAADTQGTSTVAENPISGATTVRHNDPFGNSRDASSPTWPNSDGFLNAPTNTFTATTRLGARDYSPTLGRFLTADPILVPDSPQQANGYAYSINNPITDSDPSGKVFLGPDGGPTSPNPIDYMTTATVTPIRDVTCANQGSNLCRANQEVSHPYVAPHAAATHHKSWLHWIASKIGGAISHVVNGVRMLFHCAADRYDPACQQMNPFNSFGTCYQDMRNGVQSSSNCRDALFTSGLLICAAFTDAVCAGAGAADTGVMDLPASTTWGRADSLTDHFVRHGGDFGATTEAEYAQQASGFFQRGIQDGLPTKINPKDGSIRIYDPQSNTFGAYNANGTTRTFYKPDPAQHGYATNWDYWVAQPGYAP